MTDPILRVLQETEDLKEKSAIVAEAVFALLPNETALAARRAVILHWFDQFVLEAILEDCQLTIDEMNSIYEQLIALPFIDKVPSGLTFQNLTREGLVKLYSRTQPELLQIAASLAAPSYEMREEDKKSVAEALFCYIVAGDQEASASLQNFLLEDASRHQDWQHIDNLLQIQEEAEQLPFVQPLSRNEQELLIRGLVHRIQSKRDAAILDYEQALAINPKSVLAYISRGTTYAEQDRFEVALIDYNTALHLNKNSAQAYLGRGVIYTKQGQYIEALRDSDKAIQLGLRNEIVLINKGNALNNLERYEEALGVYEEALHLNANAVDAYVGKGQAFNELGQYKAALEAYEEALRLDATLTSAFMGQGQALNGLERYSEALTAYETAIRLNPNSADAYRGKGQALSRLKRYAEASSAFEQANQLEPQKEEAIVEGEDEDDEESINSQKQGRSIGNGTKPATFFGRVTQPFRPTQNSTQTKLSSFWKGIRNSFTIFVVVVLVLAFAVLFRSNRSTSISFSNPTPISVSSTETSVAMVRAKSTAQMSATGTAVVNATATAGATLTDGAYATGTVAFDDALKDNTGGNQWQEDANCSFSQGVYDVKASHQNTFATCFAKSTNFSNFSYRVLTTIVSGDCSGIAFRGDANSNKQYYFEVCQTGTYDLLLFDGSLDKYLIKPTSSAAIKSGLGKINLLAITANNDTIQLYTNATLLNTIQDPTLTAGSVGVVSINHTSSSTEAAFAGAKVWTI